MNKEDIVTLLVKNLKKAIPEFADGGFDASKSYKDLGVSSMELVEVVTKTGQELGMTIPFAALASVKTTDDLAGVLLKIKNQG